MKTPLCAAVLVGGQSQRMGSPKHDIAWGEGDLLHQAIQAAQAVVDEVVLVGRPLTDRGLPCLADVPEVDGPLSGLLALSRARPEAQWIVLSCDMPWISEEAVRWLASWADKGHSAVIPRTGDGRLQPLCALYGPGARVLLESLTAMSRKGPRALADESGVHVPEVPDHLNHCWVNVNTPEELERCTGTTSDTLVI